MSKPEGNSWSKWLGPLNFWVLQWFCLRLVVHVDDAPGSAEEAEAWSWYLGVLPLTGWWGTRYRWLFGKWETTPTKVSWD